MVTYESRLGADAEWAMSEGSRHFEGRSAVQEALHEIAKRLDAIGVAYAVAGGMALFRHGYRRFTEDIDILVSREGLETIRRQLEGRGYVAAFPGSRSLRDASRGVRVEFLVAGDFPGDGKPKPVAFPDPASVQVEHGGIRYVPLETLIEMKLASGISSPGRLRDLSDVLELVRVLGLAEEFGERLNPYVREKYRELWRAAQEG